MYPSYTQLQQVAVAIESITVTHFHSFWFWHWTSSEEIISTTPFPFALCSNGLFQDAEYCIPIPPCTAFRPKRCPSGECVELNQECATRVVVEDQQPSITVTLMEFLFPYRSSRGDMQCRFGQLCADGLCRPSCSITLSCGLGMVICPDGSCVYPLPGQDENQLCRGSHNCPSDQYRCFNGACVSSIRDCSDNHYLYHIATEVTITLTAESIGPILLYDSNHEPYATVSAFSATRIQPSQPLFLHVSPLSTMDLSSQYVVISDKQRAKELDLRQVLPVTALQITPAVSLTFIALENNQTVSSLMQPIEFSLLLPTTVHFKPSAVYDNTVYRDAMDLQENEFCPAQLILNTWKCLDESEYSVERDIFRVRVKRPMKLTVIVYPQDHLTDVEEDQTTVSQLVVAHFSSTLYVAIPVFLICLAVVVFAEKWRVQWEIEKDKYTVMRIRADKEATVLFEMTHTQGWKQIGIEEHRVNPLATKRMMSDIVEAQLNEARRTAEVNEEVIEALKLERDTLYVRVW